VAEALEANTYHLAAAVQQLMFVLESFESIRKGTPVV
jgi:hypothetical protein